MSDNDLIRRGDALYACQSMDPEGVILCIPAVKTPKLENQLQDAFFAGFAEGSDGGWVEGDPTPAWNKYLEGK